MTYSCPEPVAADQSVSTCAKRAETVHEPVTAPSHLLLMDRLIDLLIQKAKTGLHWPDVYDRATSTLSSLGLSPRRSLLAGKRLRNAQHYAASDDFGAAAFELRLVRTVID